MLWCWILILLESRFDLEDYEEGSPYSAYELLIPLLSIWSSFFYPDLFFLKIDFLFESLSFLEWICELLTPALAASALLLVLKSEVLQHAIFFRREELFFDWAPVALCIVCIDSLNIVYFSVLCLESKIKLVLS